MKQGIHPEMKLATVTCACGNTFQVLSVREKIIVEVCSQCHPFFTGRRTIVDTTGRVERFMQRASKALKSDELKQAKRKKKR